MGGGASIVTDATKLKTITAGLSDLDCVYCCRADPVPAELSTAPNLEWDVALLDQEINNILNLYGSNARACSSTCPSPNCHRW